MYDQPWVHNTVPGTTDSAGLFTPDQCLRYAIPTAQTNTSIIRYNSPIAVDGSYECGKELKEHNKMKCDRWVFDTGEYTIVQEWLITCKENQWLLALVGTFHFTGIVIGSAAAGVLADKYINKY